jgi:hypothetical protein
VDNGRRPDPTDEQIAVAESAVAWLTDDIDAALTQAKMKQAQRAEAYATLLLAGRTQTQIAALSGVTAMAVVFAVKRLPDGDDVMARATANRRARPTVEAQA